MATIEKDIRPGDIWAEADGDYVQIIEEDFLDGYTRDARHFTVNAYYNATDECWTEPAFADDEVYYAGALRNEHQLETLIYRQEEIDETPIDWRQIRSDPTVEAFDVRDYYEEIQNKINDLVSRQDLAVSGVFVTKDSGSREVRPSGYQRDTQQGKPRFDLLIPSGVPYEHQMLTRFAQLLARGAEKYTERNWERANDVESLERFKASALRHLLQWFSGETDEDHAAAVMYNVLAFESTNWKMANLEDPNN